VSAAPREIPWLVRGLSGQHSRFPRPILVDCALWLVNARKSYKWIDFSGYATYQASGITSGLPVIRQESACLADLPGIQDGSYVRTVVQLKLDAALSTRTGRIVALAPLSREPRVPSVHVGGGAPPRRQRRLQARDGKALVNDQGLVFLSHYKQTTECRTEVRS